MDLDEFLAELENGTPAPTEGLPGLDEPAVRLPKNAFELIATEKLKQFRQNMERAFQLEGFTRDQIYFAKKKLATMRNSYRSEQAGKKRRADKVSYTKMMDLMQRFFAQKMLIAQLQDEVERLEASKRSGGSAQAS